MIAGGWIIVVMDMLSPYEFQVLIKAMKEILPLNLFDDSLRTPTLLYEAGFVHGDIYDMNIIVAINNQNFRIIDFN